MQDFKTRFWFLEDFLNARNRVKKIVSMSTLFLHTESYRYKSSQVKLRDRVCVMDLYYESTAPKLLIS